LHPIAAGDMYGIKGIDHIAKPGLLSRVLAGSYPSGPSSLAMPAIWKMIVDNQIEAYNVPSGILFDMHRDAAARRPGVLTNGGIVIAQVKRVVKEGSLRPHDVHVPCNLVDYIVVDPAQMQTTQTEYDPAISGEIQQPLATFEFQAWGPEKVIARRAALELAHGSAVNLGFGISPNVPRILLEEGLHGEVTWAIEQGAVGGMPLLGFAFGCASNADAIVPSPQ